MSKILTECSDIIGKVIEDFVSGCNIGADTWRWMGVLIDDGNTCLPQKVTYERIRKHVQTVYNYRFTIVLLCVARNKHHLKSHRYKGVAKVTTRRACKLLQVSEFDSAHSDYVINRDDVAGFRLYTLTTSNILHHL